MLSTMMKDEDKFDSVLYPYYLTFLKSLIPIETTWSLWTFLPNSSLSYYLVQFTY
jgi:hypothetical protein